MYVSDGAGSGAWGLPNTARTGFWTYQDAATAGTPIALTVASTWYDLTNDGAGSGTSSTYKLSDASHVWDTAADRFVFTDLSLGDTVDVALDVDVITGGVNTAISLKHELGLSPGTPVSRVVVDHKNFKTAATHNVVLHFMLFIDSTNILDNPGRLQMRADATGTTVIVNDVQIRVITGAA